MTATLYSLCHESFVGPLLWIASPEAVRARLGKPLRLKLSVKDVATHAVVYSTSLASFCPAGHDGGAKKTQVLALIELPVGLWAVEVENVESRQDLAPLRPTLTIHPGGT